MRSEKTCPRCGECKPIEAFYFRNTAEGTRHAWCGQCFSSHMKDRRRKAGQKPRPISRTTKALEKGSSRCESCGFEKPLSEFYFRTCNGKKRIFRVCKTCECAAYREWMKSDAYKRLRVRYRVRKYGLTVADYEEMLRQQRGLCAVCRTPLTFGNEAIDHDHKTGKVRGLLHRTCNLMIGNARDDPKILVRAAQYLIGNHPQVDGQMENAS